MEVVMVVEEGVGCYGERRLEVVVVPEEGARPWEGDGMQGEKG